MLMPNILARTGATLVTGPPLAYQSFVTREIVASATPNNGWVLYLGDSIEDGTTAVHQFWNWEKLRNRSQIVVQPNDYTGAIRRPAEMNGNKQRHFPPAAETFTPMGPHLGAIAFHHIKSVHDLANTLNENFAEYDVWPRIVVRDISRKLSVRDDPFLAWLPELSRLAPANYLHVTHTGVRGAPVTQNQKPFTATWVLSDGHAPPPAQRYGERWNVTDVSTGRIIKLQGQSYPSDLLFNLYEAPKEKVLS
jgi:hypothetical protein